MTSKSREEMITDLGRTNILRTMASRVRSHPHKDLRVTQVDALRSGVSYDLVGFAVAESETPKAHRLGLVQRHKKRGPKLGRFVLIINGDSFGHAQQLSDGRFLSSYTTAKKPGSPRPIRVLETGRGPLRLAKIRQLALSGLIRVTATQRDK